MAADDHHPYDKATGELIVTAPAHYQIVANGLLVEEVHLPGNERRTHWKQSVPIPASWLYALGMAGSPFTTTTWFVASLSRSGPFRRTARGPTSSSRSRAAARSSTDFERIRLARVSDEKLGHVQAAGLSGGTEHASAISTARRVSPADAAPWCTKWPTSGWGNAVTEKDWDDVWLSEGFATYFTHLYAEQFNGRDAFVRGLKTDVNVILQAQLNSPGQPVIHRNLADMRTVLNRLVYQKGGWVLPHVCGGDRDREVLAGVRDYYRRYRNLNASTDDLRQAMEQASGTDLAWFFDQWLKCPWAPKLSATWRCTMPRQNMKVFPHLCRASLEGDPHERGTMDT